MTHNLWTALTQRMLEYLSSVTLAELVEQQHKPADPHVHQHDHGHGGGQKSRRTIAVASA